MGVLRTALALGVLTISVPLVAQSGRAGGDRARAERGREARPRDDRSVGQDKRGNQGVRQGVGQGQGQGQGRGQAGPGGNQGTGRNDVRSESRNDNRYDPRADRGTRRVDPRNDPRVESRSRVDERLAGRDVRIDRRDDRYDRRPAYRFNDRDFRHREIVTIGAWFRSRGGFRTPVYVSYGRSRGDRYDFRPGIFLSSVIFARLEILPYDLDLELGYLPWYLERRIYGRSVLIVDVRTRQVVDVYDIDW